MGDSSGRIEVELRAKARQRIGEGTLPRARAARTWGGLGTGLPCDLCDQPIDAIEPEYELQFDTSSSTPSIRFHRQCHSVWDAMRHEPATEHEHWTPVEQALPPIGVPVEVRWDMGESRQVIIGAMRARDAGARESLWINLTTKAPLPHGWHAIEWRPSPVAPGSAHPHVDPVFPRRA